MENHEVIMEHKCNKKDPSAALAYSGTCTESFHLASCYWIRWLLFDQLDDPHDGQDAQDDVFQLFLVYFVVELQAQDACSYNCRS